MRNKLGRFVKIVFSVMILSGCVTTKTVVEGPLEVTSPDIATTHNFYSDTSGLIEEEEEKSVLQKRAERVSALESLLEQSRDKYQKSTILLNLAGEQYEYALEYKAQATVDYQNAMTAFRIGETAVEPKVDLTSYKEALTKHVNILRQFTNSYPQDKRRREALLSMAISMADLGHELCGNYFAEARKGIVEKENLYRYQIAQADWYSKQQKWDEARKLYSSVIKSISAKKSSINSYASYRLGFVFLAQDNLKKAEIAFKVAYLTYEPDIERRFHLQKEVVLNLAKIWAIMGKKDDAMKFSQEHKLEHFMLDFNEFLAQEYLKNSQYEQAIAIRRDQIEKLPLSTKIPNYRADIALAYMEQGQVEASNQEIQSLEKMTTDAKDPWFEEHGEDEVLVEHITRIVKALPYGAGFRLARKGLESTSAKDQKKYLDAAVKLLTSTLSKEKDLSKKTSIHLSLVRSLMTLGRVEETLNHLDQLIKLPETEELSKVDIAFERLKIILNLDAKAKYAELPPLGEVSKPIPLPPLKKRFFTSVADYLKLVPKSDNKANLNYQVADTYFKYGHYPKALQLMEELAIEFPRSEEGRACIQVMVSLAGQKQQFNEVIRLTTILLNNRQVKGKAIRDFLKESLDWAKAQPDSLAH